MYTTPFFMEHKPELGRCCWHISLLIVTVVKGSVQLGRCALHVAGHVVYFDRRNMKPDLQPYMQPEV